MLDKLILHNYRSYEDLIHTFKSGLNLIVGANAIGKTTIVEAIGYAFFGNDLTRGPADTWIKRDKKQGWAELYFDHYVIRRGNSEQWVKDLSISDPDKQILARQNSGVTEWVSAYFGFNAKLYGTASYIAQKDIESFASLTSTERIKRVEKLLGLDIINTILNNVKGKAKELRSKIKIAKETLMGVDFNQEDLDKRSKKQSTLVTLYEDIKKEYESALVKQGAYKSQLASWNKKEKLKKLVEKIVYFDIPYSPEELTLLKDLVKNNERIDKELKQFEGIEPKDVSENLKKTSNSYLETKGKYKQLLTVTKICPTCGRKIPSAEILIKKREQYKKDLDKLEKNGKKYRAQQKVYDLLLEYQYIPLNIEEIDQLLVDTSMLHYWEELQEIGEIEKPKELDIESLKEKTTNFYNAQKDNDMKIYQLRHAKELIDKFEEPLKQNEKKLKEYERFIDFLGDFRKEFGENIVPLISENARNIFHHLTEGKYKPLVINKDYSIEDYHIFSGSERDAASFALRIAIAQVAKIKNYNTIILDEVAASFDKEKETLLLEILQRISHQLIYISHEPDIKEGKI